MTKHYGLHASRACGVFSSPRPWLRRASGANAVPVAVRLRRQRQRAAAIQRRECAEPPFKLGDAVSRWSYRTRQYPPFWNPEEQCWPPIVASRPDADSAAETPSPTGEAA